MRIRTDIDEHRVPDIKINNSAVVDRHYVTFATVLDLLPLFEIGELEFADLISVIVQLAVSVGLHMDVL